MQPDSSRCNVHTGDALRQSAICAMTSLLSVLVDDERSHHNRPRSRWSGHHVHHARPTSMDARRLVLFLRNCCNITWHRWYWSDAAE